MRCYPLAKYSLLWTESIVHWLFSHDPNVSWQLIRWKDLARAYCDWFSWKACLPVLFPSNLFWIRINAVRCARSVQSHYVEGKVATYPSRRTLQNLGWPRSRELTVASDSSENVPPSCVYAEIYNLSDLTYGALETAEGVILEADKVRHEVAVIHEELVKLRKTVNSTTDGVRGAQNEVQHQVMWTPMTAKMQLDRNIFLVRRDTAASVSEAKPWANMCFHRMETRCACQIMD